MKKKRYSASTSTIASVLRFPFGVPLHVIARPARIAVDDETQVAAGTEHPSSRIEPASDVGELLGRFCKIDRHTHELCVERAARAMPLVPVV